MDKKAAGIVATVLTGLLCGCPGLFSICVGALMATVSFFPNAQIDVAGQSDPGSALVVGVTSFCLGILFVLIPVLVGFFSLRREPMAKEEIIDYQEPIPPTS